MERTENKRKMFPCLFFFFNLEHFYITKMKYQIWDLQIKYIIRCEQNNLTSISAWRMRDEGLSTDLEVCRNTKRLLYIENLNYSKDRLLLSSARKLIWWYLLKANGRWKGNIGGGGGTDTTRGEQLSACHSWHPISHLFHFCMLSETAC